MLGIRPERSHSINKETTTNDFTENILENIQR